MKITIDEGPDQGLEAEIPDGVFTIGRGRGCSLVLKDSQVSSRHAAIETLPDGSVVLRDLGSTNGTFLNGQRVQGAVPISGTERVMIGQNWVQFSDPSAGRTVIRPGSDRTAVSDGPPGGRPLQAPPPQAAPAGAAAYAAPAGAGAAGAYAGTPGQPPGAVPPTGRAGGPPPAPRGRGRGKVLAAAALALLVAAGVAVAIILVTGGSSKLTTEQLIARATPSVVRIIGNDGAGSGVVVNSARGLILTNAHVVVGNTALKAQIGNATATTPVRLVAASPCDDLAVVKLAETVPGLKALPLGTSSKLHPGDQVMVLGFPGSFQTSVGSQQTGIQQASTVVANTGTVSQVNVQGAPDPSLPTYQDLIVHQAPTNHGNSGGPLLNQDGQVVGINTLSNPDTQGQYYSIAIDYAKRLLPDLEAGKSHALLGWDLIPLSADDSNLQSELQSLFSSDQQFASEASALASDTARFLQAKPPTSGLYDAGDQPGTPADKAGTSGFLIDKINGTPVTKIQDVCDIVNSASPGQTLRIHNYNIDSGNDPTQLSAELAFQGKSPDYTTDLKMPGSS